MVRQERNNLLDAMKIWLHSINKSQNITSSHSPTLRKLNTENLTDHFTKCDISMIDPLNDQAQP